MSRTVATILGARIRERRRTLGVTQAELARRIGISASYLNLIEHNKRGIAGALLRRTAEALSLELSELDGAAERRLLDELDDIAQQPDIRSLGVEADRAGEFVGRFPGWARAVGALARAERQSSEVAHALSDRLSHDPFLGETVHQILTQVASVRSAAEILDQYGDLSADERQRFERIIRDETGSLGGVVEALASYFDKADTADRHLTPVDEVEALFEGAGNSFPAIEAATEGLDEQLPRGGTGARLAAARALAEERARRLVGSLLEEAGTVTTEIARERATAALMDYAALAIVAPMPAFAERAAATGYDVEALVDAFGLAFEHTCLRLTALPAGTDHPRFGYLRANAAGTLLETRELAGLAVPRHGFACPLWALYRAQQFPGRLMVQRTAFPTGLGFVFVARARDAGTDGFEPARHLVTDMLTLSDGDAARTVYGREDGPSPEPVGTACRTCARRSCRHRVADPLAG